MYLIVPITKFRHILSLAIVFISLCGYAQPQHSNFVQVAPESLSNTFVRCFYKDSKNYMWIGTADGLVRYDGTNTYRYEHSPDNKNSLCHNNINAIVEDSSQRLWIGTAHGLCIYDREKDYFINVDTIDGDEIGLNNFYITDLSFDKNGLLWIGTHGGGINVYDPAEKVFSYLNWDGEEKSPALDSYIVDLLFFDELMWCGTKGGLEVFNVKDMKPLSDTYFNEARPQSHISYLTPNKDGDIWMTTVDGSLIKTTRKGGNYSFETKISGDTVQQGNWSDILTLCDDGSGNLWIGGDNSGLNHYNTKENKVTHFSSNENSKKIFPSNSIRTVFLSDDGYTWIGTFNKGAYLVDDTRRNFYAFNLGDFKWEDIEEHDVRAFTEDQNGNIWLALEGIGLVKLEERTNTLKKCDQINKSIENKYLTSLLYDRNGDLWIGTGNKGVYKVDPDGGHIDHFFLQSGGFGDDKIYCLYEDKSGTIWAGTYGSGLFRFDRDSKQFSLLCEKEKENYITKTSYVSSLLEDSEGVLWVSTMYGLYALKNTEKGSFEYEWYAQTNQPGSLSSSAIQSIHLDENQNLWIGTNDNGLNVKIRGSDKFKVFQKSDGLTSNTIRGIISDREGNLWISGNMGLTKFDYAKNAFTTYTREDGLSSNNFNINACLKSSDGKLFFGSTNGFNAFYPDSIPVNKVKPVVYLTDLKINNQSVRIGAKGSPLDKHISLTSKLKLPYEKRSFMIDFVAINYGQSFRHNYCYKLEGFDEDWNCIGSKHSANYTNLDPGDYVLLVKASNNAGVWSAAPARLEISIQPLIWKTWWAYSIYFILMMAGIFLLIKVRSERINMRNQIALERLAHRRERELSESKAQFFTNISHEFRTPLSLISMPLENLTSSEKLPGIVKERLSTMRLSVDKMMRLVNELMDFSKLENTQLSLCIEHGDLVKFIRGIAFVFNDLAEKKNIQFGIHSTISYIDGWFDHDKLEKILVNTLSNAFKFTSENGEINLMINTRDFIVGKEKINARCLEIVIVDDGIGIPPEELPFIFDKFYQAKPSAKVSNTGTGIGLYFTKGLVELHKGSIRVESSPGKETKFVILLPIDRDAYKEDDIYESGKVTSMEDSLSENIDSNEEVIEENKNALSMPKILIVEDDEEMRKYVSIELRERFNILEAKDGEKGLELAFKHGPDLIISDILMPLKSGIDLCKEIKSNIKTSHIPIILLTAKVGVDDKIKGVSMGADLYITKPFSIRYLLAHINQIIESRQQLYSRFSQDVYLMPAKVAQNEIDQEFLQKAIDYIIDNILDTQLGVDSIAKLFSLSRMQVYRKIKALTGNSVVDFIRMIRLKEALKLMETQKYSLSEIAYQSGFNSASYFTRCFKDHFGKTPSEYLKNESFSQD